MPHMASCGYTVTTGHSPPGLAATAAAAYSRSMAWGRSVNQGTQMSQHTRPQPDAAALEDTVRDTTADIVQVSRRRRIRVIIAAAACIILLAVATVIVVRATGDPAPTSPANHMTPELAVSFVQDEFPGTFTDSAKLVTLFTATCGVLDAGGNRDAATAPMLQGGLTTEQASYILDMAINSTCPKYAER